MRSPVQSWVALQKRTKALAEMQVLFLLCYTPFIAYHIVKAQFSDETIDYRESFKVIYMNRSNHVLGCLTVSEGGSCSTAVDVKLILQGALLTNASGVILAHNHPSENLKPSKPDKIMTERIRKVLTVTIFSFVYEGVM